MKLVIIIFSFINICFFLNGNEFSTKNMGKLTRNEIINFPDGGKFIAFKHEGGFETDIGKFGKYECIGSILYNNKSTLDNMLFACKNKDQDGDTYISMGKRKKGSDIDRAVGQLTVISATGFWKAFIGYKCTYSIVYVEEIVFAPGKCKK